MLDTFSVYLQQSSQSVLSLVVSIFGGVLSFIAIIIISFYLAVMKRGIESFIGSGTGLMGYNFLHTCSAVGKSPVSSGSIRQNNRAKSRSCHYGVVNRQPDCRDFWNGAVCSNRNCNR